jgi:hypothetical protein
VTGFGKTGNIESRVAKAMQDRHSTLNIESKGSRRQEVGGVLPVVAAGNSGRVPEEKRSYCGQKKATC